MVKIKFRREKQLSQQDLNEHPPKTKEGKMSFLFLDSLSQAIHFKSWYKVALILPQMI